MDMRAKFVPAEALYPSTTQPASLQAAPVPPPTYGTIDYSAFSQPPTSMAAAAFVSPEPVSETFPKEGTDYGSDLQIPQFDPAQFTEGLDNDPFLSAFNYKSNGATTKLQKSVPSSSTKDSPPDSGAFKQISKFGFGYEALSENIEELELTSSRKDLIEKFSQAKYQIEMGNIEEGDMILNDMMQKNEIRYKPFSSLENHIMSTFAPISE